MKFFCKFFFISILINSFINSQEYTIIVKSQQEERSPKRDIITVKKENFHYTLDKLLEKESGIMIQKYGGEGSYSLIRIRGSNANQVQIYLDGIPLNFASYSEVDLSDLYLFNYEKIELQKNGSLTSHTGSAMGGSINLVPNFSYQKNQLYFQGGSFNTFGGGIFYNQFYKKELEEYLEKNTEMQNSIDNYFGGWTISLYRETSDQNFKFRNHNGTIYFNTFDDYNDIRKNSQYKKNSGLITGVLNLEKMQIRILNDSFYRNHGIPGPITKQTEKTKREHFRNTTGFFTDSKAIIWETFRLQSRIYYTYINNNFKDPKNELSFGSNSSKAYLHNKGTHLLPEWNFLFSKDFVYKMKYLLGYEEEYFFEDKYTNFGLKTKEMPEKKRYHYSYHFHNTFIFKEFIEFLPEFRYEEYRNNFFIETQTKKILTTNELQKNESKINFINEFYHLILTPIKDKEKKISLFLKYNEEKRIPAFIELFGEKGSIVPNLKLRPEQSYNTEGGIILYYKDLLIDLRAYQKKVKDLIRFLPNSQFSLRAENIEKARIKGGETTIKFNYKKIIKFFYIYQFMEALKINNNNFYQKRSYIPLMPLHTAKVGVSIFPEQQFEYQLEVHYYGAFYRNESNDYFSYQFPKWYYNFIFYYRYKENFLFYLEVKNLQNKGYEDIIGYPLPGRSFFTGIKYFF